VAAELAHNAVPMEAAANVGRDVKANAVGPAATKPKAVVETTRAERRALESSDILERCELLGAFAIFVSVASILAVMGPSDADFLLLSAVPSDAAVENKAWFKYWADAPAPQGM